MKALSLATIPALALGLGLASAPGAAASGAQTPEGAAPAVVRTAGQIIVEATASEWRALDPAETLYVELETGRIIVELAPDFAPAHVAQMKTLAREGFYDGLAFYRVVEGFVAQAGDLSEDRPIGTARRALPPEFERPLDPTMPTFTTLPDPDGHAAETGWVKGLPAARDTAAGVAWLVHCPGATAMARGTAPDTGSTEFYVVLGHAPRYLDRNLSVFGRVVRGQELLQKLTRGRGASGVIEEESERGKISSVRVAVDLPAEQRTPLEILRTDSDSFRDLVAARRNRTEEFFVYRPDHIDVCAVPIPVRDQVSEEAGDGDEAGR